MFHGAIEKIKVARLMDRGVEGNTVSVQLPAAITKNI